MIELIKLPISTHDSFDTFNWIDPAQVISIKPIIVSQKVNNERCTLVLNTRQDVIVRMAPDELTKAINDARLKS